MNRHTKIAILIAPILAIGGYIASDLYVTNEAQQNRIFQLVSKASCDVLAGQCVLSRGELKVNVYDEDGVTTINTTFPIDSATLFLVNKADQSSAYPLQMSDSPYYWFNPTPLRADIATTGDTHKMRLILKIQGGQYISEFYTQTGG